jgi:hypothetical protein
METTEATKAISIFLALVISLSAMSVLGAEVVYASSPSFQICIMLDGSSSITAKEWDAIIDTVADSIVQVIPRNESIELSVVQFGYSKSDGYAKTEVSPTVIKNSNYASFANHVRAISRGAGETSTVHGLSLAWREIKNSANFQYASRQIINIVTDGLPGVKTHNSTSDIDDSGVKDSKDDFITIMHWAIGEGLDELDVEAVGMPNSTQNWWLQWGIFPQPSSIVSPFTKSGWIRVSHDVTDFADTIDEDFQSMLRGSSQPTSWPIYLAAVLIVIIIVVIVVVVMVKRKKAKPEQVIQHHHPPPPPPAQVMAINNISKNWD